MTEDRETLGLSLCPFCGDGRLWQCMEELRGECRETVDELRAIRDDYRRKLKEMA